MARDDLSAAGRQVLPRLFVRTNTEAKLLFLLPAVRPLYAVASAIANPFASKRQSKEEQRLEQSFTPDYADDQTTLTTTFTH